MEQTKGIGHIDNGNSSLAAVIKAVLEGDKIPVKSLLATERQLYQQAYKFHCKLARLIGKEKDKRRRKRLVKVFNLSHRRVERRLEAWRAV